jgi:hypothetical protein
VDLSGVNSFIEFFSMNGAYWNKEEWAEASLIPKREDGYGNNSSPYKLYNAGDAKMPFKIYFELEEDNNSFNIECADSKISLEGIVPRDGDKYIVIDSHSNTVNGCDINYKKTGNLYNYAITDGNIFVLPVG